MVSEIGYLLIMGGFLGGLCSTLIYLVLVWRMERYIQRAHPDIWQNLGEPHLVLNNSIRSSRRMLTFLRTHEYEKVNDDGLDRHCSNIKKLRILVGTMWAIALVGSVLVWALLLKNG